MNSYIVDNKCMSCSFSRSDGFIINISTANEQATLIAARLFDSCTYETCNIRFNGRGSMRINKEDYQSISPQK